MEKTYTVQETIEIYNALNAYAEQDIKLPSQLAWDIEDNLETLKKIVDKFEKHRTELIQPLADKGAFTQLEDDRIKIGEEYIEEFTQVSAEIDDYLKVENTIEIKTTTRESIPAETTIKDVRALKFMITE